MSFVTLRKNVEISNKMKRKRGKFVSNSFTVCFICSEIFSRIYSIRILKTSFVLSTYGKFIICITIIIPDQSLHNSMPILRGGGSKGMAPGSSVTNGGGPPRRTFLGGRKLSFSGAVNHFLRRTF